jgi:hypothetical protein
MLRSLLQLCVRSRTTALMKIARANSQITAELNGTLLRKAARGGIRKGSRFAVSGKLLSFTAKDQLLSLDV